MIFNTLVVCSKGQKVTVISFTIASTSYQAEEGMTWNEWINSNYNTDGYALYTDNTIYRDGSVGALFQLYRVYNGDAQVSNTDIILEGTAYSEKMIVIAPEGPI